MKIGTMWEMLGGTSAPTMFKALGLMPTIHRVGWLAGASKHGVLLYMHGSPRTVPELLEHLEAGPEALEVLTSWLKHGCLLKEIRRDGDRYLLRGSLARAVGSGEQPHVAAFLEALVSIHLQGVYGALDALDGSRGLADLDAELISRASELLGPLLREALDTQLPKQGALRLLEFGCGRAPLLRHACSKNPDLEGVGVDLVPAVVAIANELIAEDGYSARARAVSGDLRTVALEGTFDRITMFNLLYYFAHDERDAVIESAAARLSPGGRLLLVGSCRGGTLGNNILDIWFSGMPETGPLPRPEEMVAGLERAGLSVGAPQRLLPGEQFWMVVGAR